MAPLKRTAAQYVRQKNQLPPVALTGEGTGEGYEASPPVPHRKRPSWPHNRDSQIEQDRLSMPPPSNRVLPSSPTLKFYDTDASNIEGSSTNTGPTHGHPQSESGQPMQHIDQDLDSSPIIPPLSSDDDDSTDEDVERTVRRDPALITGELDDRQMRKMQSLRQRPNPIDLDGNRLGHLDGDTFPSQTSGPPSRMSNRSTVLVHGVSGDFNAQSLPVADSGNRYAFGGAMYDQRRPQTDAGDLYVPTAASHSAGNVPRQIPMSPPQSRFSRLNGYGYQDEQELSGQRIPSRLQQFELSTRHTRNTGAHPAEREIIAHRNFSHSKSGHVPSRADVEHTIVPILTKESDIMPRELGSPVQQTDERQAQNLPETRLDREPHEQTNGNMQVKEEENPDDKQMPEADIDEPLQLDYSPAELYQMQYTDIMAQDFDIDPRDPKPESVTGSSIVDRMQVAFKLPSDQQSEFVNSLKMDEWEEAGEWFLEQFGDLVRNFRAARQRKRKAARSIEDEILQRHKAVVKKREAVDDTMEGLRAQSHAMLHSSPGRFRKSSKNHE